MESRFLLNIVVCESSAIFELFSCEDKSLLVWGDALLVLDLSLYVLNRVAGLDIEGDSLSGKGFYEDLHLVFIIDYNFKWAPFKGLVTNKMRFN